MKAMAYINFRGECREAIELYIRAFDARLGEIASFNDIPQTAEGSRNVLKPESEWILHATLKMGENEIHLSDCAGDLNTAVSERVSVAVVCSPDEVRRAFTVLSEQGSIGMPVQQTFYSPCCCVITDKFGVMWNIWAPK